MYHPNVILYSPHIHHIANCQKLSSTYTQARTCKSSTCKDSQARTCKAVHVRALKHVQMKAVQYMYNSADGIQ